MKFIDLETLKVHKSYNIINYVAELGTAEELFDMGLKELEALIKESFEFDVVTGEDAVLFEAQVDDCESPDDFEYLVNIITDNIFALNTLPEARERESRLGVPKNLKDLLHCNTVPLQKAVNNKCKANIFNVHIYDTIKGWDYKIVND